MEQNKNMYLDKDDPNDLFYGNFDEITTFDKYPKVFHSWYLEKQSLNKIYYRDIDLSNRISSFLNYEPSIIELFCKINIGGKYIFRVLRKRSSGLYYQVRKNDETQLSDEEFADFLIELQMENDRGIKNV